MMSTNQKKGRRDHSMLTTGAGGMTMGSIDWRKAAAGTKKDLRSRLTAVIRSDKSDFSLLNIYTCIVVIYGVAVHFIFFIISSEC